MLPSIPSLPAFIRTKRTADLPSSTHSKGVVLCLFFTRYSAEIATMPRPVFTFAARSPAQFGMIQAGTAGFEVARC